MRTGRGPSRIREALRNAGLRLVETSDSRAALESMNAARPTSDQDNPSTKSIPVLLTTAGMKDDDRRTLVLLFYLVVRRVIDRV